MLKVRILGESLCVRGVRIVEEELPAASNLGLIAPNRHGWTREAVHSLAFAIGSFWESFSEYELH